MAGDYLFISDGHNAVIDRSTPLEFIKTGPRDANAHTTQGVADRVRYVTGNFWVRARNGTPTRFRYKHGIAEGLQSFVANGLLRLIRTSEVGDGHMQQFEMTQIGTLEQVEEASNIFDNWFLNNRENYYTDYTTSVNMYENNPNEEESSRGLLDLYCKTRSEYNYLHINYENKSRDQAVPERNLPNFYNLMLRPRFSMPIITMGGRLEVPDNELPYLPNNEYFEDWSRHYDEVSHTATFQIYGKFYYYNKVDVKNMSDFYYDKEYFPMFTTIEFNTDTRSKVGSILEETRFALQMRDTIQRREPLLRQTAEIEVTTSENIGDNPEATPMIHSSRKYYDLDTFFSEYEFEELDETIYAGFQSEDQSATLRNSDGTLAIPRENRAYYHLMALIVQGKIQKLKKESYRKYSDIIDGKLAYSEPVIYFLEKRDKNGLIQTFMFVNSDETEVINFVDSQVKYGKEYRYVLKSWNVVIGTKYRYELYGRSESGNIIFNVYTEPHPLLTEVKLLETITVIADNPPINPDVEIIPIVGSNDKIRIHLNSYPGRFMRDPITFTEDEDARLAAIRRDQGIAQGDSRIIYESDDNIDRFLVYRTDFLPSNYKQFDVYGEKREVATGNTFITGATGIDTRTNHSSFIDNILPNRKYYYCFRSVDVHGNLSYPSEIYQVEIVDDHGSTYPIIKVCELDVPDTRQPTSEFKRFMYVSPSSRNLTPNNERMGIDWTEPNSGPELGQEISLGTNDDAVWGKRFKIRIRSKTTGRAADFHFTFEHEQEFLADEE